MSKRNSMCFSLLVSLVCLIIFTVAYIISHTLTPAIFFFNLITCIIFFIIVYFSFSIGYTEIVDNARKKD